MFSYLTSGNYDVSRTPARPLPRPPLTLRL